MTTRVNGHSRTAIPLAILLVQLSVAGAQPAQAQNQAQNQTQNQTQAQVQGQRQTEIQGRPGWKLVWSDEFNGPDGTAPNPSHWGFDLGGKGFGNNELETYTSAPANVEERSGSLVITARQQNLTGADGIARHYTSARLRTQGLFSQAYGRFEARMKLPSGKGIWPAFWLLGADTASRPWPACGEIDIMEAIGDPHTIYSTIHGPGYSGAKGIGRRFTLPAGETIDSEFHTYAVEWAPNDLKFFFDDHLIVERTPADLPAKTKWVYDHPFFIILNLAVGGDWPGAPDRTTVFPKQTLVDYVRVYQAEPDLIRSTATPPAGVAQPRTEPR